MTRLRPVILWTFENLNRACHIKSVYVRLSPVVGIRTLYNAERGLVGSLLVLILIHARVTLNVDHRTVIP